MDRMLQRLRREARSWPSWPTSAGLLGYYDAELAPALHGNLVLFATCEVPPQWHRDRVHAAAVALAPRHYRVVRLHRGMIGGALLGRGHVVIQRTRYFDFGQQP